MLTRRLDYLGIQKAEVTVDTVGNRLLVRFPNQPGITQSDYPGIVSILTARSALTLRDGIASDEQGRPTGEILLEEKDILLGPGPGRPGNRCCFGLAFADRGRAEQI